MRFKYVWEPFLHLKYENGPECGVGMDCPDMCNSFFPFE